MRIFSLITHIVAWILFLSLPILFVANQSGGSDFWSILFSWKTFLFVATYVSIFYLHTYVLIPQLFARKRWFLYAIALLLLLLGVWALRPYDRLINKMSNRFGDRTTQPRFQNRFESTDRPPGERNPGEFNPPPPGPPDQSRRPDFHDTSFAPPRDMQGRNGPGPGRMNSPFIDIISIFLFIIILVFSLAINFLSRLRLAEQRALKADADKANAELSFLKAQINPHFLFNTLNNIYSLAASKSEHTAESVMKLSNIMRYVTDDVAADFVPLENEVDFIRDYIDLQLLRLGKKTNVQFSVSGELEFKRIAPLVLVTFIENVFKYGISNHEKSDIIIEINAKSEEIVFFSQNKLFAKPRNVERVGIGIANTRKRLEHLYADKYLLDINTQNEKYTVTLTLQLNSSL